MTPETRGLLIVHAWMEQGSDLPLRAHLRAAANVKAGFESDLTLSSIDAVCDGVRAWLELIAGPASDPDPDTNETVES
jgi:hypothetical protein